MTTSDEPTPGSDPGNAPPPTRHAYDATFRAMETNTRVVTNCYLKAFGEDALEGADPDSAIAASELRWLIHAAGLTTTRTVVDLGCGRGGPGMVVAQWTGARLIGIDWSIVAVSSASRAAARVGTEPQPLYLVADMRAMPFADASIEALISIDVLQLIPDRDLVFQEVRRVLRPGGVLAFTSWELVDDRNVPPRLLRMPRDYEALASAANLRMYGLEVSRGARDRDEAFWACIQDSAPELRRELGDEVAGQILGEASLAGVFNAATRRVLCVARA